LVARPDLFVQLVVYPLFAMVGEADYIAYHRSYTRRIPLPVIIPGFTCFLTPIALSDPRPRLQCRPG